MAAMAECKTCDYMVQATKVAFQRAWERNGVRGLVSQMGLEADNLCTRVREIVNPIGARFSHPLEFRTDPATGEQKMFWQGYRHSIDDSMRVVFTDPRIAKRFTPEQITAFQYQHRLFQVCENLAKSLGDGEAIQFIIPRDVNPENGVSFGQIVRRGGMLTLETQLTPLMSVSEIQGFQEKIGQARENVDLGSIATNDISPVLQWVKKGVAVDMQNELPQVLTETQQHKPTEVSQSIAYQRLISKNRFDYGHYGGTMIGFEQAAPALRLNATPEFALQSSAQENTFFQFTNTAPLFAATMLEIVAEEAVVAGVISGMIATTATTKQTGLPEQKNKRAEISYADESIIVDDNYQKVVVKEQITLPTNIKPNEEIETLVEAVIFEAEKELPAITVLPEVTSATGQQETLIELKQELETSVFLDERQSPKQDAVDVKNNLLPVLHDATPHGVILKKDMKKESERTDRVLAELEGRVGLEDTAKKERAVIEKGAEKAQAAIIKKVKTGEVDKRKKVEKNKKTPSLLFLPLEIAQLFVFWQNKKQRQKIFEPKPLVKAETGVKKDKQKEEKLNISGENIYPRRVETNQPTVNAASKILPHKPSLAFLSLLFLLKIKFQLLKLKSHKNLVRLFIADSLLLFLLKPELFLVRKRVELSRVFDPATISHTIRAKT